MKKMLALAGAAALVASTAGIALAAGADDPQRRQESRSTTALAPVIVRCDGGPSVNMRSRSTSDVFTLPESGDVPVPGASLLIFGPPSGTDTVVITFTAESRLFGAGPDDWMGIEAKRNGVNIAPVPFGNESAFTGENSWNGNAAQWCATIPPGQHTLQIFANVVDSFGDSALSGWLDDYQVTFTRYE